MIKVSVFYPNDEGAHFDMEYYRGRHLPMVRARLGTACKGVAVEHGLAGGAPGSRPAFIVMGHMYFDTVEAFQASFGPHATEIMQDVPKYTNLQPILQISEVTISLELAAAM
jgi:uncharacterized protein (TIGR02118 family)